MPWSPIHGGLLDHTCGRAHPPLVSGDSMQSAGLLCTSS